MIQHGQKIHRLLNRHAAKVLLPGLLGVVAYNWRLWQRDRAEAINKRMQKPPVPPAFAQTPKVTVLVAAWNECERIEAHIRSFLSLSYPNKELILCAGGTDGTLEMARTYAGDTVMVLEQKPGEGKQRSLARSLEQATGEIIYLTDADCLYADEPFLRMIGPLIEEGEHVTTGHIRPLDEQLHKVLPWYLWASDTVATVRSSRYGKGLRGANAALTRSALEQSGGMHFTAQTGTDYHLALRLVAHGFQIRQVPESVVPTEYSEHVGMHRRRQSRWLRNLILYGQQYGARDDVVVTVKTVSTGVVMVLTPLVGLFTGRSILIPWTWLVAHASFSKLRYVLFTATLYQQSIPMRLIVSLLPLTLVDFIIWASPVLDLLQSSRRKQW
jgi:cellulose synthase/poly-beta-1,6-N-acetylglucosamine synthase-like glycosyltransferase